MRNDRLCNSMDSQIDFFIEQNFMQHYIRVFVFHRGENIKAIIDLFVCEFFSC